MGRWKGDWRLTRATIDFVSYSAYDWLGGDLEAGLTRALDYLQAQMHPKPGIDGRRVFIGEYGFAAAGHTPAQQDAQSRRVIKAGLRWGCPFVLYWEIYNNETLPGGRPRGFWLIDGHNIKQPAYNTHAEFYR